ncbi:type II toxin-antitoxin system RelB/DinJ family antitoxin [Bifidobacterium sp. ESL0763]|uniref:type II toxin-antitoxin system RelB/DinJ family antitoxin n=1 Tax=Bifidobacterium sp. ESL0763 TaxID=2983227 RepID=UPI0023F7531A|nr:type II toxin-antitoxin system RelB/DinJ family antitoxin [Bifidobacterium sp. ESL0763]MDF7664477.1 type II toxin-antitoxin system RelB/DinJ family antitoxin [Bifidobacterium sp. ESL0763]
MATTTVSFRTDKDVKDQAKELFASLGMDLSTAINVFLRQSIRDNAIPFRITGDDASARARYEAEHHIGKAFDSVDDLMGDLEKD